MRVLHVNSDPGIRPGSAKGAWVHVEAMRRAFGALGCEVIPWDGGARGLEDIEADFVYERFALRSMHAAYYARERGIPYVLEVNSPLDEEERRHRPGKASDSNADAIRVQLALADLVLCVSDAVAQWALDRGANPLSVIVAANAVDPERFHSGLRTAGVRERLGIEDRFVLGFHGRLRPWHGFDGLVQVAARLLDRGVPVHFLTVGNGEYEETLASRLPKERYDCVQWVNHAEVGSYVAAYDALALGAAADQPYYFSPLKLLEAMACAVPVAAPDLGDLRATFGDEAISFYDSEEPQALEELLVELSGDSTRASERGQAGARMATKHTWVGVAHQVLSGVGVNLV